MGNTALNISVVCPLTNKSGGAHAQGDVCVTSGVNASAVVNTTEGGYSGGKIWVCLEPNGVPNDAVGLYANGGYVPKINLNSAASLGDLVKTHTVAKQGTPHAAPSVVGDFAQVLGTGTSPAAVLFGAPNFGGGSTPTTYPYLGWGTNEVLSAEVDITGPQLCNEIKGWPSLVNSGDLDYLNLWFDKIGTPTTAPSVVALSGEGGITEQYEHALKCVTDAADEGLMQRFTFADEPRVKSGRKLSTLWAIWCVGGVGVTLKCVNSDATHTDAAKVTAAGWTIVEVPDHTLAGTYCDIQLVTDGAGTFYAVPLGANIGARGLPLRPRGLRFVDAKTAHVLNIVDPGGAGYADLDLTSQTSPLCAAVEISLQYQNTSSVNTVIKIRRNGDSTDNDTLWVVQTQVTAAGVIGSRRVPVDDGQVIEWCSSAAAGDVEYLSLNVIGYWEWE